MQVIDATRIGPPESSEAVDAGPEPGPRSIGLLLATIGLLLAVAVLIRIAGSATRSLRGDDPNTVLYVAGRFEEVPELRWTPLSHWLVGVGLRLVPDLEQGARLFSVLASLAGIGVIVLTSERAWGWRAGLFALALMALHPWSLYFAQEVRYPILVFLFGALLLECHRRSLGSVTVANRCATVLILMLGTLSHLLFLFLPLSLYGGQLIRRWVQARGRAGWIAFGLLVVALVTTILTFDQWTPNPLPSAFGFRPLRIFQNFSRLFLYLSPFCWLLAVCSLARGSDEDRFTNDCRWCLGVGLLLIGLVSLKAWFAFRYLGWLAPVVMLLATRTVERVATRLRLSNHEVAVAALLILMSFVPGAVGFYTQQGYRGSTAAYDYIRRNWREGDVVLSNGSVTLDLELYLPGVPALTLARLRDSDLAPYRRAWLLLGTSPGMSQSLDALVGRRHLLRHAELAFVHPGATPFQSFATVIALATLEDGTGAKASDAEPGPDPGKGAPEAIAPGARTSPPESGPVAP